MEYHNPDTRWEIFSFNNFEEYGASAVVKGKFHTCVPQDITEDFLMAEYIMAHAYYHYPLYHEAFFKVLRTIEMAVKWRCKQLNISFEFTNNQNKLQKNVLARLMDDLVKAEPLKELKQQFKSARSLRNSMMHPERFVFSGAMSKGYIKQSVTLLNTLFLPEKTFSLFGNELQRKQTMIGAYRENLLVLEASGMKYLLSGITVEAAVQIKNEWSYLLIGYPVMLNTFKNLTNHSYLKPLSFSVIDIGIINDTVEVLVEGHRNKVFIYPTNNSDDVSKYEAYFLALKTIDEKEKLMYQHNTNHEVGKIENDFWYEKLWKV